MDLTIGEMIVGAVYFAMAGYIMYLQHIVEKVSSKTDFLQLVLVDVCDGKVDIRRTRNGFAISKKQQAVNGETS